MSVLKEYGGIAVAATAAVLVLSYLAKRQAAKVVDSIVDARQFVASSIGETVHDWFYPQYRKPMFTYTVIFPNGTMGAVNSEEIDADGFFTYWRTGSEWRIAGTEAGKLIAIPADLRAGEMMTDPT